ncbi:MAG: hypothetical protein U0V56_07420 [Actinomycetota bacterium]
MRRAIRAAALVLLAAACTGEPADPPSATASATIPSVPSPSGVPPTASPTTVPTAAPTVAPTGIPPGVPGSFDEDVEPSEVPPGSLVPPGTTVTDVWYADTPVAQTILVAYVEPGTDPLRQEHALVVWRRFEGQTDPWRPVFGLHDPPERGVLAIRALIGDATGDGSPDALTFEDTGGSGACGTWRVIDLAANIQVFKRRTCDTTLDLSADPVGLSIREAVYEPGDAHCCPSAMRTSVLTFDATTGDWIVESTQTEPT